MRGLNNLLKWLDYPINAMLWLGIAAGVAMMLHVVVDVTARSFLNMPFAGTTEVVAGWYMVAVAYLPLVWITRHDNHIIAGVFAQIGSVRFAYWLEILVKILMTAYVAVFTYQTFWRAIQQTRLGEVWQAGGGFLPIWPSRWLLPIAGASMVIYLVLRILRDIIAGLTARPGDAR